MIRLLTTTRPSALHRRSSSPMLVALFSREGRSGFDFARFFSVDGRRAAGLDGIQSRHQGRDKFTVSGLIVTGAQLVRSLLVLVIPDELIDWDHAIPRGTCRHHRFAPP